MVGDYILHYFNSFKDIKTCVVEQHMVIWVNSHVHLKENVNLLVLHAVLYRNQLH